MRKNHAGRKRKTARIWKKIGSAPTRAVDEQKASRTLLGQARFSGREEAL
jgi:hypothetical protein